MDLKELQEQIGDKESTQKLSSKVIKIITLDSESERLGNIEHPDLEKLFKLKAKNLLYYNNSKHLNGVIDAYLNLSVSLDGKMIDNIKEMFKSAEIHTGEEKK